MGSVVIGMGTETFLDKRFRQETSMISREIAGEFIIVPIRTKTSDIDSFYALNEVGARIWQLVDGRMTVREVLNVILLEYDVEPGEAQKDLLELLQQLELISAIREI
jgi:hypothetical protein